MHYTVKDTGRGPIVIKGNTEVDQGAMLFETFDFKRFSPTGFVDLAIFNERLTENANGGKYRLDIIFRQNHPELSSINDRFWKVRVSINGSNKIFLQPDKTDPKEKLGEVTVEFLKKNTSKKDRLPIAFQLWIDVDWLKHGERHLLTKLTDMYVLQTGCDVQFVFEDKQSIGGHKTILSAVSSVFTAMFQPQTSESQTGKVHMIDVPFDIFKQLLYFIYSGSLEEPLNVEEAKLMYGAANKYDIAPLMEECAELLLTDLELENVVDLLVFSDLFEIAELTEAAFSYIESNASNVCKLEGWNEFTYNHPALCVLATRRIVEYKNKNGTIDAVSIKNKIRPWKRARVN